MTGGENFERAKLKWRGNYPGVKYPKAMMTTPFKFQRCVDVFLRTYPRCTRLLSNKEELEKLGLSGLDDIYKRYRSEKYLDKNLGLLYLMVKNHTKLFKDTDSVRLIASLYGKPINNIDATKYDSYSDIVQEIISVVHDCMKIESDIGAKMVDIENDISNFWTACYNRIVRELRLPPRCGDDIFDCLLPAEKIISGCASVCYLGDAMGM